MRGSVCSVCQSSKDEERAWGLRSALTLSPTSATLWLCHCRHVSPLSERLFLLRTMRAIISAFSSTVTASTTYHSQGILVSLNGGDCLRTMHSQPFRKVT